MKPVSSLIFLFTVWLTALASAQERVGGPPIGISTFECIGLYWKPVDGATENVCSVHFRIRGEAGWREGQSLWFDATDHPDMVEHSKEYRGSIVGLKPGTEYEIKLRRTHDTTDTMLNVFTWSDQFPVAKTVVIPAGTPQPFVIKEGGSKSGYVVYTMAAGTKLDGGGSAECNVKVEASFVILRGLTLANAAVNGIELGDVKDLVIEGCDVSGWGRIAPDGWGINLDSAIYAKNQPIERMVVQDCRLHHPRSNSNSWTEPRKDAGRQPKHPNGPQCITLLKANGHYVIRRNHFYSDEQHKFNDTIGEVANFGYAGFPGRDSDVYDNEVSQTYDDGIELEGGDMNVRAWNNHFDDVYGAIGSACVGLGPMYLWKNVLLSSRKGPGTDEDANKGGYLVKLGHETREVGMGALFVYHNTMVQTPPRFGLPETTGGIVGIAHTGPQKFQSFVTSRNNVFYVRGPKNNSVNDPTMDPTNDLDYDLYNGQLKTVAGTERHGINGVPKYDGGKASPYALAPGSPGIDAGIRLPNFNDGFLGKAPDIGAVESR